MVADDKALERIAKEGLDNVFVELLDALSAIKQLSEISCQEKNEETLIKQALSALVHNQDMERCSFFKLVDDNRLVNVAGLSYMEALDDEEEYSGAPQEFAVGEGIIGLAVKTRTLQHCHNSASDERFEKMEGEKRQRLPGSIISVPVFAANLELIGVLNISHPEPYYFTEWHIRLLEIFKNVFGQLVSNYRLFRHMEQQIAQRTEKLEAAYDDIKKLKEYYQGISVKDVLTGLYNRRYFYKQAGMLLAQYKRYHQPLCFLILDLDYFKKINDNLGHAAGDKVLISVAETLKAEVRESDVLVRFGGEEFVIVFTNTTCENGCKFAERIRQEIEALNISFEGENISLTVSIGLFCLEEGCYPDSQSSELDDLDIDTIVKWADTALYQAKAQGRNQVVRYCQTQS